MRQFDVCRNPNPAMRARVPYLVILQSDLLDPLATVVVAPLLAEGAFRPVTKLHPVFEVEGERFILSTGELAGVPRRAVGERISSLAGERDAIIAALDLLFTGI
ncbi:CcdB family protein [Rhodobium orientis]|uniref:Toxin CcdB n=1 Tax=Rhodobium orientis TaxID=34017 RepID=A0A327JHB5_9HYPH|nr:CcdB family protein [Rhodobium orientis]MBK5951998.1 plasmid maintenance protein CcdB [Rhodobium orientis]RAI25777.1 plasmid maintenance protein CcdB [Rhodobium orientis]